MKEEGRKDRKDEAQQRKGKDHFEVLEKKNRWVITIYGWGRTCLREQAGLDSKGKHKQLKQKNRKESEANL